MNIHSPHVVKISSFGIGLFYDKDHWFNAPVIQTGNIRQCAETIAHGIDSILADHGYQRNGAVYTTNHTNPTAAGIVAKDNSTLIFFCHFGISYVLMAHLPELLPAQLWHRYFTASTSVTILNAEERKLGTAMFRVQFVGCTRHLLRGNEPISASCYFSDVFQD